jgi:hypothetical protein
MAESQRPAPNQDDDTQQPIATASTDGDVPLLMAVRDPNVHRIYTNGFTLGITNADAHVVLQWFGRPIAVVNLSYTLAKTLAQRLTKLVEEWELRTRQNLQTTDAIDEAFKDESKK